MIDFLILYDARSGSTFLSRKLMERYQVLVPPEAGFFAKALTAELGPVLRTRQDLLDFCLALLNDRKFADWGLPLFELERQLDRLLPISLPAALAAVCRLYSERAGDGEGRFGIKKGSYIFAVETIRRFFPEMKYVCLIRDGRAVFASKKRALHSASGEPFAIDPVRAARRWREIRERIRRLQQAEPDRTLVIKYEELIRSPETMLRGVAEFLGAAERTAAIDAGANLIPDKYRHLHANTGQGAQAGHIDKWRRQLTRAEIYCFEAEAREALAAEGYPLVNSRAMLHRPLGRLVNGARLRRRG